MIYKLITAELRSDNFSYQLKLKRGGQIITRVFEFNSCTESMCNQFSRLIGIQTSDNPKTMLEGFKSCIGSQFFVPVNGVLFNPYGGFKEWLCTELNRKEMIQISR